MLLLLLLGWTGAAGPVMAQAEMAAPVRQVVLDIMSFTRWPEPPAFLRLCIVGQAQYAAAFFSDPLQSGGAPVRPRLASLNEDRLGSTCDAVYAGPLSAAERDVLARQIASHPVLTVGEPAGGCTERLMFCLQVRGTQVSFATNLDAIARSGVRLNPRVLLLGRRGAAPS